MENRPEVLNILLYRNLNLLETDEILLNAYPEELEETLYILKEERGGRNTTRIRMLEKEINFRKKPIKEIDRRLQPWERKFIQDWNEIRSAAAKMKAQEGVING